LCIKFEKSSLRKKLCKMRGILLVLAVVLMISCDRQKNEDCAPNTPITLSIEFESLENAFVQISDKEELKSLLNEHPIIRDYIFAKAEYPNDSIFFEVLYQRFTNPHIDTLHQEVKRVFGDGSKLKSDFEQAFNNIKSYYPDFVPPKVQTVISGLDTDMFISDSLIIVSLDFYLGEGAKYRPQTYQYLLRKYGPEDIVPSTMLIYGIDEHFNKTNLEDRTVLADMIAYGKSFYFAKHMLCVPDSVLIWYSQQEIEDSHKNQDLIWARLVEDQVLYSTSQMVKRDYLGDRPFTIQVGEKCPGRIGQWVGWQIVKSYAKQHPELSLQELMQKENAQTLFKESRYNPRR
jgi:hypothetical protein